MNGVKKFVQITTVVLVQFAYIGYGLVNKTKDYLSIYVY